MRARFADYTIDAGLRRLHGRSGEIHLSPKAFDLLLLLVENRSRVMPKGELQQRLWPDTFVVDTNLASLVAEIRVALEDDAKEPRFVRTAHRVGYGFCAEVTDAPEESASPVRAALCWLIMEGRRISLQPGDNILGRDVPDGVSIDSPSVSRRHARISVTDGHATIADLDSKNGTFVRGERIAATVPLNDGDEVRVGAVALQFRQPPEHRSTMTLIVDRAG